MEEFLRAVAVNGGMNLHVDILAGRDAHHMAEGVFKALARALDVATQIDPRVEGVPSTKGVLCNFPGSRFRCYCYLCFR